MCSTKNSPLRHRPKRAAATKAAIVVPTRPPRRPKPRKKPKYLSLKLELSSKKMEDDATAGAPPSSPPLITWVPPRSSKKKPKRDPLRLFPLHPESQYRLDDRDDRQGPNNNNPPPHDLHVVDDQHHVALLFQTATDGTSTTLDGLLDSSSATAATSTSDERDSLSPSLSCVYSYGLQDYKTNLTTQGLGRERCGDGMLRNAIRCKERDAREEERWVSYNEVVEGSRRKSRGSVKREDDDDDRVEEEEASSNCITGTSGSVNEEDNNSSNAWAKMVQVQQLVGLKLDKYQDILDAWSDKPPFCFPPPPGDHPPHSLSLSQIVPDLHPVLMDNRGSEENAWKVPDGKADDKNKERESWKTEQREASVLRYKEKRQSRLFSKRIRYEVRKLNAEKRPRLKGRFVKSNEGT